MISSRRQFLTGLSTLIAAPAIIKVAGIMPVKVIDAIPVMSMGSGCQINVMPGYITWVNPAQAAAIWANPAFRDIPIRIIPKLNYRALRLGA